MFPQKTAVSPELLPLPLFHGGCDKLSWLPEGKVFSNVQRERIISRFLKESVLKRVFRSKQLRWEGPSSQKAFGGLSSQSNGHGRAGVPGVPHADMGRPHDSLPLSHQGSPLNMF